MAWVRCCGGSSKKSNPVLFEDGAYADDVSLANLNYNTATPYYEAARYNISGGNIIFNAPNGANCCGKYLTINLSSYAGKILYFQCHFNNGTVQTKAFPITSSSKRVIFGVGVPYEGGYVWHAVVGISNDDIPTNMVTNSDIFNYSTSSASNPLLKISKIWIAD